MPFSIQEKFAQIRVKGKEKMAKVVDILDENARAGTPYDMIDRDQEEGDFVVPEVPRPSGPVGEKSGPEQPALVFPSSKPQSPAIFHTNDTLLLG